MSPPPSRSVPLENETSDQGNPMALEKVLSINGAGSQHARHHSGSVEEFQPNKRQRTLDDQGDPHTTTAGANDSMKPPAPVSSGRRSTHTSLLKPAVSIASQPQPLMALGVPHAPSALLSKRLSSKQNNKNSRNLTIHTPSYAEQYAVAIRSAPLNSNFRNPQPPAQASAYYNPPLPPPQQGQHSRLGPQPLQISHLQPGHSLAPLLSPRASLHQVNRDEQQGHPSAVGSLAHSPRKQEFAIPPIVPSQQQPPLSAQHTSSSYQHYIHSPSLYGYHPNTNQAPSSSHGFVPASRTNTTSRPEPPHSSSAGSTTNASSHLPTTAAAVPLPPQTPTTTSFAALQRQQFLQPFEHLFDTIETTRTLKSTLDDQIRRSATLMQTLQASSTTIEGLIRNQIKEVQKEVLGKMDESLSTIIKRIEKLETALAQSMADKEPSQTRNDQEERQESSTPTPKTLDDATSTSDDRAPGSSSSATLRSPPTIVRSQNDIRPHEYHTMLSALRDRLDRLERQIES
ncbi:uncharacterized protein BYT42DRAFT_543267 [Radiomyces spectabilis]|uniref:uncharacterized protein n=1 Tax=Radiomyces spectabilis TaxID=64574 RepID=UPI002220A339|nr:uncharacterized protein BYT42DRAFT_543267 [Radiomyces spectabilis]KAI8391767.1 hypothetical protein BYT42DRAFT_543267 [Radiomyces spectabilis]